MSRRILPAALLLLLAACTNGGTPVASGGSGGVAIDINLTLSQPSKTQWGESGGYTPAITNVAVGSEIHFTNTDSFAHTATEIPNVTQFPSGSPFKATATQQSGTNLSGGFSSGALQAGSSSQTISVDRAGTYLFGCFFHYGAPMRAAIVAQ
ncbi:MAG TPA: plastocyanin/azurin family copper-binding protein [Candidatus Cybelea sp.]|jgi:plastocyanin